jgi:glycosyltransferase involved in cell wall biosynthesis
MLPKVTIIIACYNDPDVVVAVNSATLQTYPNKEIIVIDDGSNNKIKSVINTVKGKIDLLLTQNNRGQSIARNNGIKKATGDYILNWDSDDFFEPTFCEKAIKYFQEDENIKIVSCYAKRFNKKGEIDVFMPKGGDIKDFLFSNAALGSSMFRKLEWMECNGYEEVLPILGFEDWEFYIRILKNGGYAHIIPETLFNYQIRQGSTTQKIRNFKEDKFKLIISKHSELYKDNFQKLIEVLFDRISKERKETIKKENSLNYKFGTIILRPFRIIKSIFRL